MIVYNTCTTKAKTGDVTNYDLLIWIASVIMYKNLGYTVKLYCSKDDIPFLKKEHIYELYDIIDSDFLTDNNELERINLDKFWSSRKLIAMKHELELNPDSIYSDTDILMFKKFDLSHDALFWTREPENELLYVPWKYISRPNYFSIRDYKDTNDAYNCGVMWFKKKEYFDHYYNEYLRFVINNPCKLSDKVKDDANNIFACNSEQRLLKAIFDHKKLDVSLVSDYDDYGVCDNGIHLFMHKRVWKVMKIFKEGSEGRNFLEGHLNEIALGALNVVNAYDEGIYEHLISKPYFREFPLKEYR